MSCPGYNDCACLDLRAGERCNGGTLPPDIPVPPEEPPPLLGKRLLSPGEGDDGRYYGRIGIIVGSIGIFIFQFIFGPLAIVLGLVATRKGERKLGNIAVILGTADLVVYGFFTLAFIATLVG